MKKRLVSLILLSILSLNTLYGCADDSKTEKPVVEEYVPISVEELKPMDISEKTVFSGEVIPNKEVVVVPNVPGKVKSLDVSVGSSVSSGSVLFVLDNGDLQKQVDQAKKSVEIAQSNYNKVKGAPSVPGAPDKDMLRMQVEQAELVHRQALDALKNATILSPTDGIVSQVNINQGEMASSAQPSIVVIDTSKMYVEINVPENIISSITIDQSVKLSNSSLGEMSEGKIEVISPAPDDRTQLYKVKILIEEVPETLKSGMFVKVNLDINSKVGVLAVKSDAIIEDGVKNYVYIADKDRAVRKEVEVGIDSGEYSEIVKGLVKGQKVLVKGQNYVEDGSKVKIIRGEK